MYICYAIFDLPRIQHNWALKFSIADLKRNKNDRQ